MSGDKLYTRIPNFGVCFFKWAVTNSAQGVRGSGQLMARAASSASGEMAITIGEE